MKNRSSHIAIVGLLCVGFAWAEPDRPADIAVVPPTPDVPANCAEFSSADGWGRAKWTSGRSGELWVEEVRADCSARVVYVFGELGNNLPGGHFRIDSANITGNTLSFVLDAEYLGRKMVADVRYRLFQAQTDNRPILIGDWVGRSGGSTSITLEKGTR